MIISGLAYHRSTVQLPSDAKLKLHEMNLTALNIWRPLKDKFPKIKEVADKMPSLLPDIKQIDMGHLINKLTATFGGGTVQKVKSYLKFWVVGSGLLVAILLTIVGIIKFKINVCSVLSTMCGIVCRKDTKNETSMLAISHPQPSNGEGSFPSASNEPVASAEETALYRMLYPNLEDVAVGSQP